MFNELCKWGFKKKANSGIFILERVIYDFDLLGELDQKIEVVYENGLFFNEGEETNPGRLMHDYNLPDLSEYGYVYVMENSNYIKIGSTKDLGQRLYTYLTHQPYLNLLFFGVVENAIKAEKYLKRTT
jgi:hypothetical protein